MSAGAQMPDSRRHLHHRRRTGGVSLAGGRWTRVRPSTRRSCSPEAVGGADEAPGEVMGGGAQNCTMGDPIPIRYRSPTGAARIFVTQVLTVQKS